MGDPALQALDTGFGLAPVVGKFHFTAKLALSLGQRLLMPFEAAKRFGEGAIAQGGEAGNAQIDPDPRCWLRNVSTSFEPAL
jgi:hypothetical protein